IRRRENLRRHERTHAFEQFELAARRQAGRLQLGVLEVAADPRVLVEEDVLACPLEIEGEIEGASNTRILELRPSDIEGEALHGRHQIDPPFAPLDETTAQRVE